MMPPLLALMVSLLAAPTLGFVSPNSALARTILYSNALEEPAMKVSGTASATALEELAKMTRLSIDSGDLDVVAEFAKSGLIQDATTNPLLVSQAAANGDKRYQELVTDAIMYAKEKLGGGDSSLPDPQEEINIAMDKVAVSLGVQILGMISGRVSTEIDVRLSYDTEASVARALRIIDMYNEVGIDKDRVLIKLAGTWEGIQAARILEKQGIKCNITLVFSFLQAAAAAQAGAFLVSPFPGRILDWHKSKTAPKRQTFHPSADPGVLVVKRMYAYFRKYGYDTVCMPASWRPSRGNDVEGSQVDEILALAGVDEMTIPPGFMKSLQGMDASVVSQECDAVTDAATCLDPDFTLTKESWDQYWAVETCGRDKLEEGIESFTKETEKLRDLLIELF
jgi:transaldolase